MNNSTHPGTHASAPTTQRIQRGQPLRRFIRHYLEMVVAMVVGMVLLGPVESLAFDALGWTDAVGRPDVNALLMATNMTVAMAGWMRFRGHSWPALAEMSTAMYLPFVVLLVPLWKGAISESTLMVAAHLLMLPAMALVMLLRLDEYTHAHHGHH